MVVEYVFMSVIIEKNYQVNYVATTANTINYKRKTT